MRIVTVLNLAAPGSGPDFAAIAQEVAAESLASVLRFARPEACLALAADPALAALAQARGMRTVLIADGLRPGSFHLPPQARQELRDLAEAAADKNAAVLFVNPFNPLLTAQRLTLAVQDYAKAPGVPLVSVRRCRNHPCQFQRHLRLFDLDVLHLLDPDWTPKAGQADGLLASREFADNTTDGCLTQAAPGELASCRDGRLLSEPEDGVACLRENVGLARLVYQPTPALLALPEELGRRPGALRLVALLGHLRHAAALFEEIGTGRLLLLFTGAFPLRLGLMLRLIPFSARQTFWNEALDCTVTGPDRSLVLPGALPPETVGCIVCIFETAKGGEFEMQEVFCPPLAPWNFQDGRVVNLESGSEIHGRQAFPTVARPDGSFALAPLPLVLEGGWSEEMARASILPEEESIIVSNQVEYLRLLARRKAQAACREKP